VISSEGFPVVAVVYKRCSCAVHCRPPPAPAAGAFSVAAESAAGDRRGLEIPAIVEQPPTSTASDAATTAVTAAAGTAAGAGGLPTIDVQTNPELPSPARVRWMDAFSRVCAHLNQVRTGRDVRVVRSLGALDTYYHT